VQTITTTTSTTPTRLITAQVPKRLKIEDSRLQTTDCRLETPAPF